MTFQCCCVWFHAIFYLFFFNIFISMLVEERSFLFKFSPADLLLLGLSLLGLLFRPNFHLKLVRLGQLFNLVKF